MRWVPSAVRIPRRPDRAQSSCGCREPAGPPAAHHRQALEPRDLPSGAPGGESRLQKFLENSRKVRRNALAETCGAYAMRCKAERRWRVAQCHASSRQ